MISRFGKADQRRCHGRWLRWREWFQHGSNQVFAHSRIALSSIRTLYSRVAKIDGIRFAAEDVNCGWARSSNAVPTQPGTSQLSATLIDRRRAFLACPSQKRHPSI